MISAISLVLKRAYKQVGKIVHPVIITLSLIIILILGPYLFYSINYIGRVYPNIYVDGVYVGGTTYQTAYDLISKEMSYSQKIILTYQGKNYEIDSNEIGLKYDYTGAAARAFNIVRTGNIIYDSYQRINLLFHSITIGYLTKIDESKLNDVLSKIASEINKDPVEAKFTFNGNKVTEFQTSMNGLRVNNEEVKNNIIQGFSSFEIPTTVVYPNVATDQINNLGIKELIGTGSSTYFHSIPGRVFNINLAASKINGTLVGPGETFSFNQTLGDVSKFSGYQQAYIISNGRTVLGDGGGVCQVSTTLFRAVLNAGLPVDERVAHAYRVGYYEQNSPPGLDATVYSPSPDFKFTNDTGNYILIEAKNDPQNYSLTFNIYGTSDGRISNVSTPVVTKYLPPLPTIYQDDPTLPIGTLKQTDFAAAGATVTFNYSVMRNSRQIYEKTFVSNYQPWAAVYLRGTKN